MDRLLEFLAEFSRYVQRQRRARGNAEPQLWQRGHLLHLGERLIENRHPGKHRGAAAREIIQDRARHAIPAQNHRHAVNQQRREQIAEAVGMRKRNNGEIQIALGDAHCFANLGAIGQELLAAKTNHARRRCGAGGQFQEDGRPFAPIAYISGRANLQRHLALIGCE